jgi:hypothetical protein
LVLKKAATDIYDYFCKMGNHARYWEGKTVDFLLRPDRNVDAAQESHRTLRLLRREHLK